MTPEDRESLRRKLEERARRILEDSRETMAEAQDAPPVRTDALDTADESLLDELKATRADFSERDQQLLAQIREAFERLRAGTYGVCIDCGQEIEIERLRAVPWASRCAADQEHAEELAHETPPRL